MRTLARWLPVLLWAGVISLFSTQSFSSEHTGHVVLGLLHRLLPFASPATLDLLHLLIRKCAHLTEYFVFSLLLFQAIRGESRGWEWRWALWAIAVAGVYAGFDEFHQWFVPGREASPWDSLLDTAGATVAQLAWMVIARTRRKSRA